MPAASSRNAQTYTHQSAATSGMATTMPARSEVGRLHRATPVPTPDASCGERRGRRRGQQPQQQDAADGGGGARQPQHQRHQCDGDHPVAEARNRPAR